MELINHMFLMLWPLGSCWPWRDCPSQDQPFPRDSKRPPWEGAFLCNNRPRAHTPMACFFWALTGLTHSEPLSACPDPPRSMYRTPRGRPCASDPTEIIHISQPRLACSFLQKQQQRLLCPFPVVLSASWLTRDFPVWPLVAWHASPLGNCE